MKLIVIFSAILILFSPTILPATQPLFGTAISYPVGLHPSSVFAADLDGDGDQDIIVTSTGDSTLSILKNNGDGTFAGTVNYTVMLAPRFVFAVDLDGDEDQDLTVANDFGYTVSVLRNNGDGTFSARTDYESGCTRSIFAIDLDGDKDKDLAIGDCGGIFIYKNDGDGIFTSRAGYFAGWSPPSLFSSDLDGDGDQDLAVLSIIPERPAVPGFGGGFCSIWKNNGSGEFYYTSSHEFQSTPTSVFAADFDDDGDQDLAIAADSVYVFQNNGNGVFQDSIQVPLDADDLSASDLDGDGDIDLAASSGATVWISKNNGDGTFEAGIGYGAGGSAYKLFVSDLDGDGDRDIVVPNSDNNTVSILENLSNVSTKKGDLNRDADLTTADVVLMLGCVFLGEGSNCSLASADVNCDGNLAPSDVVIELNTVFLEKTFSFPCI